MTTAVTIAPAPILQFFNNLGAPNVGGTILTQVGGINYATYQDSAGTVPLPNPIPLNSRGEISNAAGLSTQLFLASNIVYVFTMFDVNGNQLNQSTYISGADSVSGISLLTNSGAGQVGFNNTVAYAAGTVGSRLREDMSSTGYASLQAAVTAAAGGRLRVVGAWSITAAVVIPSGTEIVITAGANVSTLTADISHFSATGATGIKISGPGTISKTGIGTAAYAAAVSFTNCTNCHVEGVTFTGMQWAGVYLNGSSKCSVKFCNMSGWLGTVQDAADVCIQNASNDNIIEANWLFGGGAHGVLIQDPYTTNAQTPARNTVANNSIGQHTCYGVAVYMPAQQAAFTASIGPASAVLTVTAVSSGTLAVGQVVSNNTSGAYYGTIISLGSGTGATGTYNLDTSGTVASTSMAASTVASTANKIIGNHIQDIQGAYATNRSSGAGIYVVGAGASGTVIASNTISNVCVQTLDRQLAPAGIGISGIPVGAIPPTVVGNTIVGGVQGDGVLVTTSMGGANVSGNTVRIPVTSNGSGVGGSGLAGSGIRIENSALVTVDDPSTTCLGTGAAMIVYANAAPCSDITLTGGMLYAATGTAFNVASASSAITSNLNINGTRIKTAGSSAYGIALLNCAGVRISADVTATTLEALRITGSTQVRVNGGSYLGGGAPNVSTSSVCTGGFMDQTAYWSTGAGGMLNAGTGFHVEWSSNAAPVTGTWAVGDRTEQSIPAVGQPKGWRCTVAGAPGTQVSEGNL